MLELPGITRTGDAEQDVDKILRYLARFVPQLQMELEDARADRYGEAMAALSQEVGTVDKTTTAGALAAHELRRDNPHKVTAAQLGLTLGGLVAVTLSDGNAIVRIGEKRGLQVNFQPLRLTVTQWTQRGGVAYADVDLGAWVSKIPVRYATLAVAEGGVHQDYWIGAVTPGSGESVGTARIYHECDISIQEGSSNSGAVEETRVIPLTIIGLGVFGYGDEQ